MFEEKLKKIVDRFDFLEKEMQRNLDRNTFEEYSKEYSELKEVREIISQFFSIAKEIEETLLLLKDKEFAGLAESELLVLKSKKYEILNKLRSENASQEESHRSISLQYFFFNYTMSRRIDWYKERSNSIVLRPLKAAGKVSKNDEKCKMAKLAPLGFEF